jgi:uncharacterized membrane protein
LRNNLTRKLVLAAMLAAMICVVTMFAKWPIPGTEGYIHAGDGFIYMAAAVLGGPWAAAAAGLGSMFADLFSGYLIYAPATLVIKAVMALLAGLAFGRKIRWPLFLLLTAAASAFMVVGYGLFDFAVFGYGVMLTNAFYDLFQAAGGVVLGLPLALLARRIVPADWVESFVRK